MIWFTSDSHYNHRNIVRGVSSWPNKNSCRNFNTVDEMNMIMVESINRVVKVDDTLFHLGDWSFHGKEYISEFRKKINCKNVHLIYGNHDVEISKDPTFQELFASVEFYREVNINGQKIVLCHYPLRTWNKCHHGSWHLFGHCHGHLSHQVPAAVLKTLLTEKRWDDLYALSEGLDVDGICSNGKSFDVGIDTHPQFRPYSYTEIHDIMSKKSFTPVTNHRE